MDHEIIVWIRDFLKERKYRVKIDSHMSDPRPIERGMLSPLLFSVYINDEPRLEHGRSSYTYLFADDMAVLHIYSDKSEAENLINAYLVKLDKWRLTMAVAKCQYVIMHSGKGRPNDLKLFSSDANERLYGLKPGR